MFAKFWAPGEAKTRLAADIGSEQAAQLHKVFVQTLLERFGRTADRRTIVYAPANRAEPFAALARAEWKLAAQTEGDLGRRMQSWFELVFAAGARRAVLIGSDSPTLPMSFVESAFHLLKDNDIVLGPADDGGYYLIGASRPTPPIFENMVWSQPTVWDETVARLEAAGSRYAALPRWYDVDEWDDLLHFALSWRERTRAIQRWRGSSGPCRRPRRLDDRRNRRNNDSQYSSAGNNERSGIGDNSAPSRRFRRNSHEVRCGVGSVTGVTEERERKGATSAEKTRIHGRRFDCRRRRDRAFARL